LCLFCRDTTTTLHVHHRYYETNVEPWDYPLEAFLTLCAPCHQEETLEMRNAEREVLQGLKMAGFTSLEFVILALALRHCSPDWKEREPNTIAWVLAAVIEDRGELDHAAARYTQRRDAMRARRGQEESEKLV
jgi:hypothetical protein